MRTLALGLLAAGLSTLMPRAAKAQYFDFTTVFSPNPILTTQAGNVINITDSSNSSGLFAGAAGSDIQLTNFIVDATSPNTGTWNTGVTETITLVPTNSAGVALAGDMAVSHTFDMNYSGAISSSATASVLTPIPTAAQLYNFADGSVFSVYVKSYSGPGGNGSTGEGALGGHVDGALAGIPQLTPEPGALPLACGIGIAGVGLLTLRRRRRRRIEWTQTIRRG